MLTLLVLATPLVLSSPLSGGIEVLNCDFSARNFCQFQVDDASKWNFLEPSDAFPHWSISLLADSSTFQSQMIKVTTPSCFYYTSYFTNCSTPNAQPNWTTKYFDISVGHANYISLGGVKTNGITAVGYAELNAVAQPCSSLKL